MTAQDRELSKMRSSFLEVAALQLAPTSPAAAAFLHLEKTRLHLAQGSSSENGGMSRLSACQRCGFTLLSSLTASNDRNYITKQKAKDVDQTMLIYSCKTCGAKTRQKVVSRERSRAARSKNVADTNSPAKMTKVPSVAETQVQPTITIAKPTPARRPQAKKAKSLRAQLAASNISRTSATSTPGSGLGLMDFLKQV